MELDGLLAAGVEYCNDFESLRRQSDGKCGFPSGNIGKREYTHEDGDG